MIALCIGKQLKLREDRLDTAFIMHADELLCLN